MCTEQVRRSIMVWGCIQAASVQDLVKTDKITKEEKYHQISIHHAVASGKPLIGDGFIFQHGQDPKHTANWV